MRYDGLSSRELRSKLVRLEHRTTVEIAALRSERDAALAALRTLYAGMLQQDKELARAGLMVAGPVLQQLTDQGATSGTMEELLIGLPAYEIDHDGSLKAIQHEEVFDE